MKCPVKPTCFSFGIKGAKACLPGALPRADLTEHVFGDKLFLCCNPAAMSARMLDDEKTVSRTKSGNPFFQLVVDKQ